jgi:hypothetical protein
LRRICVFAELALVSGIVCTIGAFLTCLGDPGGEWRQALASRSAAQTGICFTARDRRAIWAAQTLVEGQGRAAQLETSNCSSIDLLTR